LAVPAEGFDASKAYLLTHGKRNSLSIDKRGDGMLINLPTEAPDPIASVIVFELKKIK
jgi:hypothetical protein